MVAKQRGRGCLIVMQVTHRVVEVAIDVILVHLLHTILSNRNHDALTLRRAILDAQDVGCSIM